jgi:hypothetical protein
MIPVIIKQLYVKCKNKRKEMSTSNFQQLSRKFKSVNSLLNSVFVLKKGEANESKILITMTSTKNNEN